MADLRDWPGDRYGHRSLLERASDLRATVRGWDAAYVALADARVERAGARTDVVRAVGLEPT